MNQPSRLIDFTDLVEVIQDWITSVTLHLITLILSSLETRPHCRCVRKLIASKQEELTDLNETS